MSLQTLSGAPVVDRRVIPPEAMESRWTAPDGQAIRRIDWPAHGARGSLLFLPGRGDAYEKYLETLAHWHARGWRVTAFDWRGQAGSGRLGRDPYTGHIGDFTSWTGDLSALWAEWKSDAPGPHVVVAHSMGGHIVLRALAERLIDPDAVVLSAPMLGIRRRGLPLGLLHGMARVLAGLGDRRRAAWKWSEKPGEVPADRIRLLTHDEARYADELWWRAARPDIVMGPASWGWVERALASIRAIERRGALEGVSVPVFLFGTTADALVEWAAIARAAARLPQGELKAFGEEARHEILREVDPVRDAALAAIDTFLDRAAPEPA